MRFVSFNLRFASEDDPQPWSRRRAAAIELLSGLAPDVLGAQEGLDHQLADLMAGLGDHYRLISAHRHDGGTEENSTIIYNSTAVEVITVEHRWLSDSPEVPGSTTWGKHAAADVFPGEVPCHRIGYWVLGDQHPLRS